MSRCLWHPWVGIFILLEISWVVLCVLNWRRLSEEGRSGSLWKLVEGTKDVVPKGRTEEEEGGLTVTLNTSSNTTTITKRPPRFLWGIMTTLEGSTERNRREIIRRTYLSYYKNNTHLVDRICSIHEAKTMDSCRLVYAFVVGANPTGPTNLVDYSNNSSHPLTLTEADVVDQFQFPDLFNSSSIVSGEFVEKDMIFLNIKENMEEGKTPSWFLVANTLVQEYEIDYIAKIDSDTLIFPDRFLQFVDEILPRPPYNQRVYGGLPMDSLTCGGFRKPHCREMVGSTYMSGGLYFLSTDLSEFISSPDLDRAAIYLEPEDMNTGQCVHSHPLPIFEAVVYDHHELWVHPIKDLLEFEKRWEDYLYLRFVESSEFGLECFTV